MGLEAAGAAAGAAAGDAGDAGAGAPDANVLANATALGTSSSDSTIRPIGAPIASDFALSDTRIAARINSSCASKVTDALSVVTSQMASPGRTVSPAFLCHTATEPDSMVGDRAGSSRKETPAGRPVEEKARVLVVVVVVVGWSFMQERREEGLDLRAMMQVAATDVIFRCCWTLARLAVETADLADAIVAQVTRARR